MISLLPLIAMASAVLAAPPLLPLEVPAATVTGSVPNPTEVYINSIAYGGSGCPQGSVGSFISADRQTFTLIFDAMVASLGPTVPITQNRLNCQLNVNLQYPSGFQYSILSTQYRGYASLDKSVTGVQSATYYFSGSSAQAVSQTTFNGPMDGDYRLTAAIPFTSTVWSPCGAALPLNINSQVRLSSTVKSASGVLTQDSIDGHVTFVVGVQWQKCTPPK